MPDIGMIVTAGGVRQLFGVTLCPEIVDEFVSCKLITQSIVICLTRQSMPADSGLRRIGRVDESVENLARPAILDIEPGCDVMAKPGKVCGGQMH